MIVALAGLPCLVVTGDEASGFSVVVPELPGCVADGETFEDAIEHARAAIKRELLVIDRARSMH
jgi:hypothetical protein